VHSLAMDVDTVESDADDEVKGKADARLALLTPIAKAFLTETGFETDIWWSRLHTRVGYGTKCSRLPNFYAVRRHHRYSGFRFTWQESGWLAGWSAKTVRCRDSRVLTEITMRAMSDADEVGAASVDYLMYSGYIVLAYMWAMAQATALRALSREDCSEPDFYRAKLITCDFYFDRILPRTRTLVATMDAGADSLMALDAEHFSF